MPTNANDGKLLPIKYLDEDSKEWCIKARVVTKSALEAYNNNRSEGLYLYLILVDCYGTLIKAITYNEQAVEWFDSILVNKVYFISGG